MKINFKKLEAETSFNGDKKSFDVTEDVGNLMKYNGTILLDIGFEKLAEEIFFSKGEVEIPERYRKALEAVIRNSGLLACIKRELVNQLNPKEA
ncbi:hypothetical protein AAE250_20855 [Bacteroides sp. GD17]|jgi:hypothetical protein|uniref:hypothetical protein n=1 Tax=Bacteroides sp. GD17 TaxID=3139826 RepID=UPI0020498229|nr:hypothetical protein [uncultured Bacteroides sp.]DAV89750.1 MAG TPA: hypothetical protein [Caudoviricetes sp.]